jgi:hypothetical protein
MAGMITSRNFMEQRVRSGAALGKRICLALDRLGEAATSGAWMKQEYAAR